MVDLKNQTIIVTACGLSPVGINTVSSLKNKVKKIIGVDTNCNTGRFFCDHFYQVPMAKEPGYMRKILEICLKESVDFIFPLTIEELITLLENKDALPENVSIINHVPLDVVKICNDKWQTIKYLQSCGVPVPCSYAPCVVEEMVEDVRRLGYPDCDVAIKPRTTHGSRGFRVISDKFDRIDILLHQKPTANIYISLEDLSSTLQKALPFPKIIVMDYLSGPDYSVYCFSNQGVCLSIVPFRRSVFIPGMAIEGEIINDVEVIKYVEDIVRAFNFSGVINIQLIKTNKGPLLYEINTRISATMVATRSFGLNFPYFQLLLSLNQVDQVQSEISQAKLLWNTKLYRVHQEIFEFQNEFFKVEE